MDQSIRWVIGIVVAVAIVALIAFARGTPEHGEPQPATTVITPVAA
jgi:hypothetical protein